MEKHMLYLKILFQSVVGLLFLTLLTGIVYPLAVFGFAQAIFPYQSNGSLIIDRSGGVLGSQLIGRRYESAGYLKGRPSASDYAAGAASNLGPMDRRLKDRVQSDDRQPVLLRFSSGSGLDPRISGDAARFQFDRILAERNMQEDQRASLEQILAECGETRSLFRAEKVNVFCFNRLLDERTSDR